MKRILPVMLLLAACATDKGAASTGDLPQWRLEPAATFAPLADSGWMRLKAVVADRDGNVYVLDEGVPEIRVFDSTGHPIRIIGRRGAGPLEFGLAYGMGLGWLGDTLAVFDPANARLTRLTRDGKYVGTWPAARFSGPAIRLHQASFDAVYAFSTRREGNTAQSILIRFTRSGPTDTIPQPEVPKGPPRYIECEWGGGTRIYSIPFSLTPIWTAGPRGELVAAWTGSYHIAFIRPPGDTLRTIDRPAEPVPVSDSEWAAANEEYRTFLEKNPGVNCTPSTMPRVETKPVLHSFVFDDTGNLWVERTTDAGFAFDVYDSAGKAIGTMPAPAHDDNIPPSIRGGRVYTIATDDSSGLQSVRSYRIVRESGN